MKDRKATLEPVFQRQKGASKPVNRFLIISLPSMYPEEWERPESVQGSTLANYSPGEK